MKNVIDRLIESSPSYERPLFQGSPFLINQITILSLALVQLDFLSQVLYLRTSTCPIRNTVITRSFNFGLQKAIMS